MTTAKAEHIKDDTPVTGEKVQPRLMLWMGIFLSGICLFLSDGKRSPESADVKINICQTQYL